MGLAPADRHDLQNNPNSEIVLFIRSQPGASLIIIKGHRHLNECAYIGDDSSEESDELREIEEEKLAREVREQQEFVSGNLLLNTSLFPERTYGVPNKSH